ncbi:MAG: hypothetical protein IKG11_08355 [Atopobiaceae bacterium]|nr:hypothetical protein [Atopobiaceae bacterium]
MSRSKLIKDTTREERLRIVQEALAWGDDCDGVSGLTSGVDAMYQPYIDGEMELFECNMRNSASSYVLSDRNRPSTGGMCMMGH